MSDGESSLHSISSLENSVEIVTTGTDTLSSGRRKVKLEQVDSASNSSMLSGQSDSTGNGFGSGDSRPPGGGKIKQQKNTTMANSVASKGDKLCAVCGDKALGCNFDAISCESCKAFFRRNALNPKQTKCIFEGNCKIDTNTRRFCPYCRLKKCFTVGMNKDLILGDDEKKKRLEKVKRNRRSTGVVVTDEKSSDDVDDTGETSSTSEEKLVSLPLPSLIPVPPSPPVASIVVVPQTQTPVSLPQSVISVKQDPVVAAPNIAAMPSISSFDIFNGTECVDQFAELMKSKLLSLSDLAFLPIALDVAATPAASDVPEVLRVLTPEEEQLLQEIVQVYDISFTIDLEPLVHIRQLDPSLNQLVNQSSITVLRLIKFAKRLTEFARLPQVCQIGILKGCWIHILILRSVSVYDSERDVWVTPRGDIPTEILKNATGFVQLHDDHVRYCKSVKSITGNDLNIVIILLVIVLFSPEGPHAVSRELVSNVQDRYLVLLKHYIESRYGYGRAAVMFPELMSKIRELKEFAEIHGRCLVDINPREIEPIMLEILDLK